MVGRLLPTRTSNNRRLLWMDVAKRNIQSRRLQAIPSPNQRRFPKIQQQSDNHHHQQIPGELS
ncbi:hypothetical protein LOAG_19030, partial [Loa loa]